MRIHSWERFRAPRLHTIYHLWMLAICFTDTDFWQECVPKAELFFRNCLLPEILRKWCTRPTQCTSTTNPANTPAISSSEPMHCYCRGPEESTMIACDNPDCPVEWFHLECLHLSTVPKGKWFCPDCQKLTKFLKAKKKN